MLQQYTLLLIYLSVATAKTITGVFNSFNSLTWSNAATYHYKGPGTPTWNAVLGWSLDGTSASPGDTFTLNMPCVFKFTTSQTSVDLTAHGVKYATCQFQAGEEFMTFSTLTCTVSNTLTPSIKALGTVTLPLAFNVGGTGSSVDLEDSKCFTAGTNTVTFNDGGKKISINVDFERSNVDPKGYLTDSRVIPSLNKVSTLFVAPQCANGYTSGTMGFANTYGDVQIDCSNIHVGITKGLNDWNYPVSSESFSYTKTCSSNGIFITYKNVPAGYRPFVDAYISATDVNSYTLSYANEYTCAGGYWQRAPFTLRWTGYRNSDAGSNGIVIVATTRTVTDSTTAVTTLPFDPNRDKTKTIEILKPIPTTTITTSYVGVTTSYLTKTAPIGETATVIVDIPYHTTTTVTSKWTGTITSTTTHTNPTDSIDTVIVQVPLPNPTVTTTEYWSQSFATTTTITGPPGNTDTVLIREPPNHTVTTTEYWSESYTTTSTFTAPPGGTDSVIIKEPPNPTVTTTEYWSESYTTTTTVTAPPGGTDTVLVREPPNHTVTTTEYWSQSYTTTTTVIAPPGGTDTVIIREPPNHTVTTTEYWSQSYATTTTITAPPGETDTVLIREPPNHTVTTTEYWSQSYATTTTITAPPGETDTVLIREPPNHTVTTTEYWSQSYATTTTIIAPPGETDTVLIREPPNPTVTTTEYWSQPYTTTTTVIAPPGETDTVIIKEPPNPTVTTTEYWSQSYTTATTVTAPPGGTDTVIIYDTMSSSEISSFSRPHYTNHTTLWSTTWVIETKTITETSCEGDKGCSWVSVSTRIVTIPNNIETPMVTNTVDSTTTESTSQSPSGIFSESGVSVETESSTVTTAQTNPSVPTTESEVEFTTKGNNGNGPYESPSTHVKSSMDENSEFTTSTAASTSTDIENATIATTGSVEASSPIISSSADETTTITTTAESTSVIEQPTNNNGGGKAPSATSSPSTTTTANNDSVITSTTSINQSQSQSNSDTQQTTLSQQMTSSLVSLHMLTTFDGSGSVIQHSTWLCGLITLLSLFI